MKNYKIITTDELVMGIGLTDKEFEYLDELFDISEDIEVFDTLSLFDGDPDFIKVFGGRGRGEIPFIDVTVNDTTIYILSSIDLNYHDCFEEAFEVLEWYIGGAKNSKEIDNNWNDWNTVKEGVAYRGGKGYYYSLYAKELL